MVSQVADHYTVLCKYISIVGGNLPMNRLQTVLFNKQAANIQRKSEDFNLSKPLLLIIQT
jgi:hypothetical protein